MMANAQPLKPVNRWHGASMVRLVFLLAILSMALPVVVEKDASAAVTVTKVMGIGAALLTGYAVAMGTIKLNVDFLSVLLVFIFTLWGWLGQLAYGPGEAIYVVKMLMNLVLMLMVMQFVRKPGDVYWILAAYLCGTTIASVTGLFEIDPAREERVAGILLNANIYGQICAQGAIIAIGFLSIRKSVPARLLLLAATLASLVGLIYSGSRGATLSLAAAIVVLFILQSHRMKLLLFALVFAFLVANIAPSYFYKRFQWAFAPERGYRASGFDIRKGLAKEGMKIFINHPVMGVGMGNVVPEMRTQMGRYWVTHNAFTQLLAETGIVGFSIFMFLLVRAVRFLYFKARSTLAPQSERLVYYTALAFATVLIVAESSSGNYNRGPWFIVFGIVGGLHAAAADQESRNRDAAIMSPVEHGHHAV